MTTPATPRLPATPGQTVGPFFGFALPYAGGDTLVGAHHPSAVRLHGTVTDGHGDPVPDALVEIWQADEQGNVVQTPGSLLRDGWTFTGFGRAAVDNAGHYSFTTVAPGPTEEGRAPFFAVAFFARGLMNRLFTRAYLPAESEDAATALASDALLSALPEDRRATLLARRGDDGSLVFDICLQGEHETVFLSYDAPGS